MKKKETRKLRDLYSVGRATVRDLKLLGITRVEQLVGKDARALYDRLCSLSGKRYDPCVLDVFSAAIAQAQDPNLPKEKRKWWYWSRIRKSRKQ
jgi:nucleotidyltransferase/DNA polymerase involved in DNA repair